MGFLRISVLLWAGVLIVAAQGAAADSTTARSSSRTTPQSTAATNEGPEHRLFERLFHNYSSESRPVANASHPVTVQFAVSFNQLLDLDEKNQILTTSVWIYEDWRDENLVWRPKFYNGQRVLMIPANYIWLPDIFIFNIAGESIDGFINVTGSKVAIQFNGHVRWMVPLIVNSACAVDVTYFPYDQQICEVKFSSWIYDLDQLDLRLTMQRPDLEHYVMNSEYDLVNVSLTREVLNSSCCPGDGLHAMVNLKIHLSRKSLYYDYIVIAPTIMLCVLTLASFLLPCHKGEKIAIGLTVFLTLYVLQLRIADNVPDTNSTPILGVFLFVVMTFNCISLIMATIVMNIKKRGDEKQCPDVPRWMLWVCHNILSRIVCTHYLWKDDIPLPNSPHQLPLKQHDHSDDDDDDDDDDDGDEGDEDDNTDHHHHHHHQHLRQHQCLDTAYLDVVRGGKNGERTTTHGRQHPPLSSTTANATPTTTTHQRLLRQRKSKSLQQRQTSPFDQYQSTTKMMTTSATTRMTKTGRNLESADPTTTTATSPATTAGVGGGEGGGSSEERMFHMKRQWFFVAEVADKFAFLIYLLTMSFTIFMILYVIPVHMRQDPVLT